MSPGRATRRRWLAGAAIVAAAAAAVLIARWSRIDDRTIRSRETIALVESWATQRGLRPNEVASRRETRKEGRVRWVSFDLGFWRPPRRPAAELVQDLVRLAESRGLRAVTEPGERGVRIVRFLFEDGRPAGRVWMRQECLVAIVIDDMGFNLSAAKRVIALPAPVTCAIIPFTQYSKTVARLARVAGKEVYVHMPMESPFRAPDVPEYRCMLRVGMTREEVGEKVRAALGDVQHPAGMNNHEGSLATESPELMAEVMEAIKPLRIVFMDSGTTEKTVAWKAAKEAGLRWERRNVFLDTDRNPAAVDGEFARLIALARQRGHAIAIGHAHFPVTLATLEKRIPEARAQGVEFVPASWLAFPGKK